MLYIAHRSFAPYGQGYKTRQNQHKLFARLQPSCSDVFSPPLSLGISSIAEYLTLDTNESADVVLEKFNAAVPDDLKASKVFACEKIPICKRKWFAQTLFSIRLTDK